MKTVEPRWRDISVSITIDPSHEPSSMVDFLRKKMARLQANMIEYFAVWGWELQSYVLMNREMVKNFTFRV